MTESAQPRIVVLDGYANNPGDLSWDAIAALGDLEVHDHTPVEYIRERCAGAQIVAINKVRLDGGIIRDLPDLRMILVLATGVDNVDRDAAREQGVQVCNIPAYSSASVAQHTIGLLLACASKISELDSSVHAGDWSRGNWCYWFDAPIELAGKTLGLIGLGDIGSQVAAIANAMGMSVLANTPSGRSAPGVEPVARDDLVRRADVISLHCPLTPDTDRLIDADFLAVMRPGAILINTARGGLLDEQAVAEALQNRQLGAAGVDVLTSEPPPADHPLLSAPRCVITPHAAWGSREARARLLDIAAGNIRGFLAGDAPNRVA